MRIKVHYIWSPSTCTGKSDKYSNIALNDSKFTLYEITEARKTIARKTIVNKKSSLFYFPFYQYHITADNR